MLIILIYHPNIDPAKTLNGVLGFYESLESQRPSVVSYVMDSAYTNGSGVNIYTSTRLLTVYGMEYIYITSSLAQGSLTSSANNSLSKILQKIPINSYFSELQITNSGIHQQPVQTVSSAFSEIDLKIVDKHNELVNLFGGEVSFSILLEYRDTQRLSAIS